MKLPSLVAFFGAALALPSAPPSPRACTNPVVRKEWRNATVADRLAYLSAAVCITKSPSRLNIHPNATLHDDFSFVHAVLSDQTAPIYIHTVPAFLPWHRYFLRVYEQALHACGYTGPALYWDFVHDSASPSTSPIWDPVTGFGGNGAVPNVNYGPRVVDGPFKDWRPLFWGVEPNQHWLARNWIPRSGPEYPEMSGADYSQEVMRGVFEETSFDGFRQRLERAHDSVHGGVGGGGPSQGGGPGDLAGNSASPNDPLFFVLHGGVDRWWWLWQTQGEGRTMMYDGVDQNGRAVGLDDMLPMLGLAENGKVGDYMDVNSLELCYTYE